MGTVREVDTTNPPATPIPKTTPALPLNSVTMFTPGPLERKKPSPYTFSTLPTDLIEEVISYFSGKKEKVQFTWLSRGLKKHLATSPVFKQTLIKELLFTLVGAFQTGKPQWPTHHSFSLQANTRKLTESNSVENHLTWAVFAPLRQTNETTYELLQQGFLDPHKCALAKAILLELIKSHQYPKAKALLKNSPPFF